jgi:uncharacterized protein YjfI (DUF2170 family)
VTKSQAHYSSFNADLNRTTIILPLHSIGIWEESGKSEENGKCFRQKGALFVLTTNIKLSSKFIPVTKSQAHYSSFNADLNRTTIILPLHSIGIW